MRRAERGRGCEGEGGGGGAVRGGGGAHSSAQGTLI